MKVKRYEIIREIREKTKNNRTEIGKKSLKEIIKKIKNFPEEIKKVTVKEYSSVPQGFCPGACVYNSSTGKCELNQKVYSESKNYRTIYREVFINGIFQGSFVIARCND